MDVSSKCMCKVLTEKLLQKICKYVLMHENFWNCYEGAVETSYWKTNKADADRDGHIRKSTGI